MSKEKIPVQDLKYVLENILNSNLKDHKNKEKRREIEEKVKQKWQPYVSYFFKKFIRSFSSPTKNLYTKEIQRDAEKRKKTFPDLLDQQKIPDSELEQNIFRRNYSEYNKNLKSSNDFITFHKQDTFLYLKRGGGGIGHDIKGLVEPLKDTHTTYPAWRLVGYHSNTLFVYKFDKTFSVDKSKIKKYDSDTNKYSGNYFFTYSEQQYSFKYKETYDKRSHTIDLKERATLLPLGFSNPQRTFKNGIKNEIQVIDKPVCFSFVNFSGIYLDNSKSERPEQGQVIMQIKKFNGKKGFKLEFVCLKITVNNQGQDLEIRVFVLKDSQTFKQLQTATFA